MCDLLLFLVSPKYQIILIFPSCSLLSLFNSFLDFPDIFGDLFGGIFGGGGGPFGFGGGGRSRRRQRGEDSYHPLKYVFYMLPD